jgi:single-strand DNA-binding protein
MVNKVILVGRLGKDPEIKTTPSGTTVTKFSVATDERYKDRDGEQQQRTEWHNVVTFGKLAEICGQYLEKGKLVYLEGAIKTDSWEDKETGKKMYRAEIVANTMKMLSGKGDGDEKRGNGAGAGSGKPYGGASGRPAPAAVQDFDDEEVPF